MRRHVRVLASVLLIPLLLAAAPAPTTRESGGVDPHQALQRKIPDVNFNEVQLADAIDHLRDLTGANIHVNWRALELLNVTRQTPVSIRLNGVPMRRVLRSLLDETGAGEMLTFYIDDGVLEITTREISDNQLLTRVYPVQDLVVNVPNFAGPSFNLQNQTNQASGGGGGGGGGGSGGLFQNAGNDAGPEPTAQQRAEELVGTIMQTVRPESWRENGGTASIRYFNGHLIVTAPRSIHEAISLSPTSSRR